VKRGWEVWTTRLARLLEQRVDQARGRARGARRVRQIVPYRGFGTAREVYVSGRVLANQPVAPARAGAVWWRNLADTYRHLESDEVPAVRVALRFAGATREAISDDEGFFRAWLTPATRLTPDRVWHDVDIAVLDRLPHDGAEVRATGHVLVPRDSAEFGIVSDMDDTVIRTEATRLLRMLKRTLLENARMRLPFAGVAAFYRALHEGRSGGAENPIFYVSSSPWNLYPLLTEFLELQQIPVGPLMLRDWGISERGVLPTSHGEHKLGAIRQIFDCYAELPFILIGDSGQEDPEIYRDVVHTYRGRVLAIYIRNVTPVLARTEAIRRLAEEVKEAGSVLLLSDDTLASARHAAQQGWIRQESVGQVERAVSSSEARPD
jgi:phosphatidate phosphatase APP1